MEERTQKETGHARDGMVDSAALRAHSLTGNEVHVQGQQSPSLSRQARQLQLRNTGFHATAIALCRISPVFGSSPHTSDRVNPSFQTEEAQPGVAERRRLHGEDMPPNTVKVLQEIHNSNRQRRSSPRTGFGKIFQDATATSTPRMTSWYNESSNTCSPAALSASSVNMNKLREISLNEKTPPPLNSPLARQVRGKRKKRVNLRSTSSDSTQYIDHLESQLAAANAKLDVLVSPNTTKARCTRIRVLTTENRSLKQDLANWEKGFSEKMQEERERHVKVEKAIRLKLHTLQGEIEDRNARVKELEWDLECLLARLKDKEGVEMLNTDLEKRVDVLSELLAHSPTKLDLYSATPSPSKANYKERTPRPRSMVPRIPSSPCGVRLPLKAISKMELWRSKSFSSSMSISESPEGPVPKDQVGGDTTSSQLIEQPTQSGSLDHGSETPHSLHSTTATSSRRTSIYSNSSHSQGLSTWGLPEHIDSDVQRKFVNRQRRMRRFASGACSLKPLILPSAIVAATPALPATAPICSGSDSRNRDISDFSLDPTTAFLSVHDHMTPTSTPTQPVRRKSTSVHVAQEQTLKTLEGRDCVAQAFEEHSIVQFPCPMLSDVSSGRTRISSSMSRPKASRPRSLHDELEQVKRDIPEPFDDGLIPVRDRREVSREVVPVDIEACLPCPISIGTVGAPLPGYHLSSQLRPLRDPAERIIKNRIKTESLLSTTPKASASIAISPKHAPGVCSDLKGMMRRTNKSFVYLAHRVIYNAWFLGCAKLNGAAWWLLGLAYPFRRRKRRGVADEATVESSVPENSTCDLLLSYEEGSEPLESETFGQDLAKVIPCRPTTEISGCSITHHHSHFASLPSSRQATRVWPCPECVEPSCRRTLRLWFHFSLAVVLAIGTAIKNGPGSLLVEPSIRVQTPRIHKDPTQNLRDKIITKSVTAKSHETGQTLRSQGCQKRKAQASSTDGMNIVFAETLGPEDFEGLYARDIGCPHDFYA